MLYLLKDNTPRQIEIIISGSTFAFLISVVSYLPLWYNLIRIIWRGRIVWPSARAWRARIPYGIVGSNPTPSA